MRIFEFTDAKEQLALVRLIFDNTWSAITQQAKAQADQKSVKKSVTALKKPPKPLLTMAARLGAKAKAAAQNTQQPQQAVQQPQIPQIVQSKPLKQPVPQVQAVQQPVPRQPLQQPPTTNTVKPATNPAASTPTTNMPKQQPQITPAPLKK